MLNSADFLGQVRVIYNPICSSSGFTASFGNRLLQKKNYAGAVAAAAVFDLIGIVLVR